MNSSQKSVRRVGLLLGLLLLSRSSFVVHASGGSDYRLKCESQQTDLRIDLDFSDRDRLKTAKLFASSDLDCQWPVPSSPIELFTRAGEIVYSLDFGCWSEGAARLTIPRDHFNNPVRFQFSYSSDDHLHANSGELELICKF